MAELFSYGADRQLIGGQDTAEPVDLRAYVGAEVHYRNGYYYLFLSTGTSSTYHVVVGCSRNPTRPYADDQGRDMRAPERGHRVIAGSANFASPGHNTIAIDDAGNWWLVYHAWDRRDVGAGRLLMIDRLIWDREGWPDVPGGQPHHKPFG